MLLVFLVGIFVSYSRGSWGAVINASLLMGITGYFTVRSRRTRRRIVLMSGVTLGIGVFAVLALIAQPEMQQTFQERATIAKDYDEGATGRFGNQIRSIPMLLERPGGFGPLRFSKIFYLEPHNSYIGAFANDGWIGGFTWIIIVVSTCFVGFRLMFVRSPYQQLSQVFWPVLFSWLLQGFQIDIDHWRQIFICFGAVWGFEAARLRWLAAQKAPPSAVASDEEELCRAAPMP
jgi:O-antigen ligase